MKAKKSFKLRLGTKIIIGFFCISLLLAFIGFISDRFTSEVRQEQMQFVNEASSVVIYTGEMESNLYQSLIFLNAIRESMSTEADYSTVQELPATEELIANFYAELDEFESAFARLKKVLGENERLPEDVNELYKSYEVYKSITHEWLKLGEEDLKKANLMFITSIEPYFRNNIIPYITQLRSFVLSMQKERNQELNESLFKADIANNIATILSILMAVVLAIYIYKSIANPLVKLNSAVTKLGEGNLDERLEIDSKDELGELSEAFNKMADGLQEKTVSKAFVDNIIESIHEALFVTDMNGNLSMVNSAATSLLGYEAGEMMGKPLEEFYDLQKVNGKKDIQTSHKHSFEFSLIRKNEERVPVLYSEAELLDNQSQPVGTVSVASDISQQKKQEKEMRDSLREKEVMLAEIHHRVKNNLAVISGLLQLQSFSAGNEEVEKALTDSQLRIQSIALVHEMLYESESLAYIKYDKYVNDLLQAISSMYMSDKKNIKLTANVGGISLTVNQAIPCSLLLNELVVNAFKHSFEGINEGEIVVDLKEKDDKVEMEISDSGKNVNIEEFNNSNSLGATLIKTLTNQLKGTFEILENENFERSRFRITFEKEG